MDIKMPSAFPETEFRAFGLAATQFFPELLSDELLFDSQEKRTHFDWSWQAVRYRYRSCAECNDEFKALLDSSSEMWQARWGDEEMTYKLERCTGIKTRISNHSMRATGITDSLKSDGTLEHGHSSPRTTKLYDRAMTKRRSTTTKSVRS